MDSSYDIFRKLPTGEVLWVETADSLEQARLRLAELGTSDPSDYTIYDPRRAEFVEPFTRSANAGHGFSSNHS
jgi:hypothetical protein